MTKRISVNVTIVILQCNKEHKVIDIRPRRTRADQIAQRVEKRIRIIPGQVVCRAQPKPLRPASGVTVTSVRFDFRLSSSRMVMGLGGCNIL
jgi:hypothetical protein